MAMERAERQLPTFTMASQNVAVVAVLLDTLPPPSTNGVGEMYRWLKGILGTVAAQQAESSWQHQARPLFCPSPIPSMGDKGPPEGL
jgi:hypothetical protein